MRHLSLLLVLVLYISSAADIIGQEKKEQLWYCIEETVKTEKRSEYIELVKEIVELCKQEKFNYKFYTWSHNPLIFQYWIPVSDYSELDCLNKAYEKLYKIWGEEKLIAFRNAIEHSRNFTMLERKDLEYVPENPNYNRNEITYTRWIELYLKNDKLNKFEKAIKRFNEIRAANDIGNFLMYGTGGIGYESPCVIWSMPDISIQDLYDRDFGEKFEEDQTKLVNITRPLMRKPAKHYNMYYLKTLSYSPSDH